MESTLGLILYMGFFFGLMYFLLVRPQKKKTKQLNELRSNIRSGDVVVTIGGIVGKVMSVKEDEFVLEVGAAKTKLTFKKWALSAIEKPSTEEVVAVEVETIE